MPATADWECVGPTNIGGRMTSLICHPTRPDVIWAGAAGGGVWKSEDAGKTWRPLWHGEDSLNVGSLAIDQRNPDVLYCGTGEANLSADSYPGVGLYRSANGGASWELHASAKQTGIPRRIGVIAIDPFDSNHIRIGGVRHSNQDSSGMYVSRDGGVTWARDPFASAQSYWCHSIVFHPTQQGTIWAAVYERGTRNGIWRTTNEGGNWTQLTRGLPLPEQFGRASLAVAPSNPNVLYALAEDDRDRVLGVFRSQDGGGRWRSVGGNHFRRERQMSYNNTIAVHPRNASHVICGGVDLRLTTDGGRTWQQVTWWDADRGRSDYAHADHHALLMPAAAPGRVYDANDGGLDVSEDGGRTWSNRSNGLAVTMYYDLDVAPSDSRNFGGGTQDNGTLVTTSGNAGNHFEILGGDGGWMVYDPADAHHLFASYYNLHIYRFRPGVEPVDVSPPASDAERGQVWMAFIALGPSDARTVFTGSNRVWRSKTDGSSWTASGVLDGSVITAIEIAPADPRRIYVGTDNGGFFRSVDGGDTWSADLKSAVLPGFTITRIETSPNDAALVLVTVANVGRSHVYRSNDGGSTWIDIDQGRLPDVPHHALAIPPDQPNTVYVSSDAGVFASPDLGQTWMNLNRNLPSVMVVDLVHHTRDRTLTAATYGRSLWRLPLPPA
jgi:photosystem II stability/assembly factor-like uncharacterized protein